MSLLEQAFERSTLGTFKRSALGVRNIRSALFNFVQTQNCDAWTRLAGLYIFIDAVLGYQQYAALQDAPGGSNPNPAIRLCNSLSYPSAPGLVPSQLPDGTPIMIYPDGGQTLLVPATWNYPTGGSKFTPGDDSYYGPVLPYNLQQLITPISVPSPPLANVVLSYTYWAYDSLPIQTDPAVPFHTQSPYWIWSNQVHAKRSRFRFTEGISGFVLQFEVHWDGNIGAYVAKKFEQFGPDFSIGSGEFYEIAPFDKNVDGSDGPDEPSPYYTDLRGRARLAIFETFSAWKSRTGN